MTYRKHIGRFVYISKCWSMVKQSYSKILTMAVTSFPPFQVRIQQTECAKSISLVNKFVKIVQYTFFSHKLNNLFITNTLKLPS